MALSWEQIQQVLGAYAQGKEVRPVSSRRTLFGIPSSSEQAMTRIAMEVAAGTPLDSLEASLLRTRLMKESDELGPRVVVGRADMYYVFCAREAGFDIPPYPFDSKSELPLFLKAANAENVANWYAIQGVPAETYERISSYTAIAIMSSYDDEDMPVRHLHLTGGLQFVDASRFMPLRESTLLEFADISTLQSIDAAIHAN
ncbi:hypothetical protein [Slackia heliotrinireducens]|uniref:hypothetical protein n=1 Tax=Slackia heliotrinireducens TaxID=84110 RepID=UPI0033157BDD